MRHSKITWKISSRNLTPQPPLRSGEGAIFSLSSRSLTLSGNAYREALPHIHILHLPLPKNPPRNKLSVCFCPRSLDSTLYYFAVLYARTWVMRLRFTAVFNWIDHIVRARKPRPYDYIVVYLNEILLYYMRTNFPALFQNEIHPLGNRCRDYHYRYL